MTGARSWVANGRQESALNGKNQVHIAHPIGASCITRFADCFIGW